MRVQYKPSGQDHHARAIKHARDHGKLHGAGLFGHAFGSLLKKAGDIAGPALTAAGHAGLQSILSSKSGSLGDKLLAAGEAATKAGTKKLVGKGVKKAKGRPF